MSDSWVSSTSGSMIADSVDSAIRAIRSQFRNIVDLDVSYRKLTDGSGRYAVSYEAKLGVGFNAPYPTDYRCGWIG